MCEREERLGEKERVRAQLLKVDSSLPPCGWQGWTSGCQLWCLSLWGRLSCLKLFILKSIESQNFGGSQRIKRRGFYSGNYWILVDAHRLTNNSPKSRSQILIKGYFRWLHHHQKVLQIEQFEQLILLSLTAFQARSPRSWSQQDWFLVRPFLWLIPWHLQVLED